MKKLRKKILNRIKSLKPEIKWVFVVAFASILIIELVLKNWPAKNDTIFHIGDIYVKICFSIVAATIFYFLNQHLPREDKKVKSAMFFNNKVKIMASEIEKILKTLGCSHYKIEEITRKTITEKSRATDPKNQIKSAGGKVLHENWKEYLDIQLASIKSLNSKLLSLYDLLDNKMLENVLSIANALHFLEMLQGNILEKETLNDSGDFLKMMVDSQRELNKSIVKLKPYLEESGESFRQRMK